MMTLAHWIENLSSRPISWPLFVAVVVLGTVLLMVWGRWYWGRRLRNWAAREGLLLHSFRRAKHSERDGMISAFGDWDSDWLEVFVIVVLTVDGRQRTGTIAFKSWIGIGPYRFRNVRWSEGSPTM